MKVFLVNGSPNEKGCTYTALSEVAGALKAEGVESEIYWLGRQPVSGCVACGSCRKTGKCFMNDAVNDFLEKSKEADGFVFGGPVHFASANGALSSFMDRLFYTGRLAGKPAAAVVSCRRGGASAAFDRINKYFTISGMPVVSSQYWNAVHGTSPDEVRRDLEGMQIMRTLGRNMAWLLKCIDTGKKAGIAYPQSEERQITNFIR